MTHLQVLLGLLSCELALFTLLQLNWIKCFYGEDLPDRESRLCVSHHLNQTSTCLLKPSEDKELFIFGSQLPIAGSSTAWSQNANGNLALSLGLVLGSTFLSPLTTPVALHLVGFMTTGDYSEDLHELAGAATGWFLLISVIVPSILGIPFVNCLVSNESLPTRRI